MPTKEPRPLTVRALIERLRKFDPESPVYFRDSFSFGVAFDFASRVSKMSKLDCAEYGIKKGVVIE